MKDWSSPRIEWRRDLGPAIVEAVRVRGSKPRDLRDAAHEACHALELGVPAGSWDFDTINHAIASAVGVRRASEFEITARTVERLVCARLRVDPGKPEDLAWTAVVEAAKGGVYFESSEWFVKAVDQESFTSRARSLADQVMLLGGAKRIPRFWARGGRR